jgi:hypothetical protein
VSVRYHRSTLRPDIEFPEKVYSAAALEFIGLKPERAKEIYDRWESRPDPTQNPDDLIDYVYAHTCSSEANPGLTIRMERLWKS